MSCNGCRVLRKGCSESCVLRPCIQWIESPEAQGHATVFVAKFFGRAGLMSFISAVPDTQRPALFQSLLFEACGRTINPVNGAVGLLWTGRWHLCQAAVDAVLRGGAIRAVPELAGAALGPAAEGMLYRAQQRPDAAVADTSSFQAKRRTAEGEAAPACNLDLSLTPRSPDGGRKEKRRRPASPSMNSEGSVTTSAATRREMEKQQQQPRLLNLFA